MYGDTIGSLSLLARTSSGPFVMLWNVTGQQHGSISASWSQAVIPLGVGVVEVQWQATYGGSFTGDIAIDSIAVAEGALPPTPTPTQPAPNPVVASFNAPQFETGRLWCNSPPITGSTVGGTEVVGNPTSPERVFAFVAHTRCVNIFPRTCKFISCSKTLFECCRNILRKR